MAPKDNTERLERAWQLLADGQLPELSAGLDGIEPTTGEEELELVDLLARVAQLEGRDEDVLRLWQEAAEAYGELSFPRTQVAQAFLVSGDDESALRWASEGLVLAREAAEEDDADGADTEAVAEALLVYAYALANLGRNEALQKSLDELEHADLSAPEPYVELATLFRSVGRLEAARRSAEAAVRLDPELAEAFYELGWVCRELGDEAQSVEAFLRTLDLDSSVPDPPWHLRPDEVEALVEEALGALPEEACVKLRDVAIFVEPAPSRDEVREGADPRLLGFFSGVPYPDSASAQPVTPDRIVLYQRALEQRSASREELEEQIRITVWHETAHFFGLDEDDLVVLGLD